MKAGTPTLYRQNREHQTAELWHQEWRQQAACAALPSTAWDYDAGPRRDVLAEDAIAVCANCPVRDECLADAIEDGDTWTIRGGLLPDERPRRTRVA